jgi:hypothetical protein
MRRFLLLLLAAASAAFCADDPWIAVTKIASGTEVRITKKGSTQPITGKFDQANDDRLLLVVKNSQLSIAKDQIDRVEARPSASRVKVEGKTTVDDPQAAKEPPVGMDNHPGPGTNTSSSVSITNRPDFQTVYRRPMGAPKGGDNKK